MIKKIIILILVCILLFSFTACDNDNISLQEGSDQSSAPEDKPIETNDDTKILIAYFSTTGNTENVVNHLNTILNADIYKIVPETPYTSTDLNYNNSSSRSSVENNDLSSRPSISGSVEDMDKYDVVFLGYPIWFGKAPKIINTFLESYDFYGKTIVPFCTSGSSGIGSSATNLHSLISDNTTWIDGARFSGNVSQSDVEKWVDSFGLDFNALSKEADEARFGLSSYNTKEVVDELMYIEKNIVTLTENTDKRILITGSTAGLGQLTAKYLIERGYKVVVHARNEERAKDVKRDLPEAEAVVIGDLANLDETKKLDSDINELGKFDVIIHNAGVYTASSEDIFKVNVLSPYILTSLVHKPSKLIYISSSMHLGGSLKIEEMKNSSDNISYSDSKLQILTFAMALARKWPDVQVNTVHPGWVPTRMGAESGTAPDNLREGYMTQVWLAEGIEKESQVSGKFFFHKKDELNFEPIIHDVSAQEALINELGEITGINFPEN